VRGAERDQHARRAADATRNRRRVAEADDLERRLLDRRRCIRVVDVDVEGDDVTEQHAGTAIAEATFAALRELEVLPVGDRWTFRTGENRHRPIAVRRERGGDVSELGRASHVARRRARRTPTSFLRASAARAIAAPSRIQSRHVGQ